MTNVHDVEDGDDTHGVAVPPLLQLPHLPPLMGAGVELEDGGQVAAVVAS